jgi:tetratricopeptide (TPR) repeat protein
MRTLAITLLLSVWSATLGVAAATAQDDVLSRAKEQYEAAAYEAALSTLETAAEATVERTQVEQYRALCLLALGRHDEADRALVALVASDPSYVPPASVASPKVLTRVSEIRKRELPGIIRRLMEDGRAAYQRKDLMRARHAFELVLRLVDDPAMAQRPEVADFKVVALGYVDLASAAPPPAPAPTPPTPAAPAVAEKEPSPIPSRPPASDAVISVAAVPIRQNMPPWQPRRAYADAEYSGLLRVRIGADGRVKTAVIEKASHPEYDQRLLEVAPTWLYRPATHNGMAVESEKLITVRLQPIPNP